MSQKQPPRVQLNFEPDYEPPPEDMKPDIDIDIKDVDVQEEVSDMMPEVVGKEKINERDIFDNIPDDKDEETGEENPNFVYEQITPTPTPQAKQSVKKEKVKKPRKPMSEEHKKKLALAREKARIARAEKSKQRAEEKALEKEEKELLKKQKVKRVQKLKAEVEDEEVSETQSSTKTPTFLQQPQITMEDIQKAQYNAIMSYETLRKARKEEKRKQQAIEKSRKDLVDKLKPTGYRYRDGSNRWDACY